MASIIFGVLMLCTAVFSQVHALKIANIVTEFIVTTPNSVTVPLNGQLYTVSKNRSHIHINPNNFHLEPCTIAINPFEDMIEGQLKVEALFDREIFVWGIQSQEINNGITSTYYSVISVDPLTCSHKSFSIPDSDDTTISRNFPPRILRYWESFDIFYPSAKTCVPCRFTLKDGGKQNLTAQNVLPKFHTSEYPFYIQWMHPDYIYVHNLNGGRSVVKYLADQHMETLKQKYFDHHIDTVAVKRGAIQSVGICYKQQSTDVLCHNEIRCERLNSKLHSVVSIVIPTFDKHISSVSLTYDNQGNSYIGFAEDHQLRLHIYDVYGQLLQSYDMGDVDDRFYPSRMITEGLFHGQYSQLNVQGFLIDEQYCMAIEQMEVDEYTETLHIVKCVGVKNYINKSTI